MQFLKQLEVADITLCPIFHFPSLLVSEELAPNMPVQWQKR